LTMSSSMFLLCVLLLLAVVVSGSVSPAGFPSNPSSPSRSRVLNPGFAPVSAPPPDAPGATIQLFLDAGCQMNISAPQTFNGVLSPTCASPLQGLSYILNCVSDGTTNFQYSIWQVANCAGVSVTTILAQGKGPCIPATITQNGVPAPISPYAKVTCNQADREGTEDELDPSTGRFNPKSVVSFVEELTKQ